MPTRKQDIARLAEIEAEESREIDEARLAEIEAEELSESQQANGIGDRLNRAAEFIGTGPENMSPIVEQGAPVPFLPQGLSQRLQQGLLSGLAQRGDGVLGLAGSEALPTAGFAIGAGNILTEGLGAAGGRAIQKGVQRLGSSLEEQLGAKPGEGTFQPGTLKEDLQDVAITGSITTGLPLAGRAVLGTARATTGFFGSVFGLANDVIEANFKTPGTISKLLKTVTPEVLETAGKKIQTVVAQIEDKAQLAYRQLIRKAVTANPSQRFNIAEKVNGPIQAALDKVGVGSKGQIVTRANALAKRELLRLQKTAEGLTDATANELYIFQRDLNALSRQLFKNDATVAGGMVGRLTKVVRRQIGKFLPDAKAGNKVLSEAKRIVDDAGELIKSKTPGKKLMSIKRGFGTTDDAIKAAAKRNPEFAKAVQEAFDTGLALESSPAVKGSIGLPLVFPKAAGAAIRGVGRAGQAFKSQVGRIGAQAGATSLSDNLSKFLGENR